MLFEYIMPVFGIRAFLLNKKRNIVSDFGYFQPGRV